MPEKANRTHTACVHVHVVASGEGAACGEACEVIVAMFTSEVLECEEMHLGRLLKQHVSTRMDTLDNFLQHGIR